MWFLISYVMMLRIHPSAIIGNNVTFGDNVTVGPWTEIGDGVTIGNNTTVAQHVVVRGNTSIGADCFIDSFASIGGLPQDIAFDRAIVSGVSIGNKTVIREHVTVHRATTPHGMTKIGNNCMLQSGSHVAHDCEVANGVIMATGSMLGGKARIGEKAFLGGGAAVHQKAVVGALVIMSGNSGTALDLPPFIIAAGLSLVIGLNLIGLRRAGIPNENIIALKACFRDFYKRSGSFPSRASDMLDKGWGNTPENEMFLKFFLRQSELGFAHKRRKI